MAALPQYKVLLLGPAGVGKTRAVQELLHPGEDNTSMKVNVSNNIRNNVPLDQLAMLGMAIPSTADWQYFPTLGVDVNPVVLQPDGGIWQEGQAAVQFNIWEIAGNHRGNNAADHFGNANFAVILAEPEEANNYIQECGEIPHIVINQRQQLQEALLAML